jgi:hypothetical protein
MLGVQDGAVEVQLCISDAGCREANALMSIYLSPPTIMWMRHGSALPGRTVQTKVEQVTLRPAGTLWGGMKMIVSLPMIWLASSQVFETP